jgi:hypothetical protein
MAIRTVAGMKLCVDMAVTYPAMSQFTKTKAVMLLSAETRPGD